MRIRDFFLFASLFSRKRMWSASNLQRPSLPKHLYRDVFDVKKQRRVITSNQKEEEEMQTSRIRNEKKVLSRLHNSFFSSTRTGIDPKRVPTYSPGPIYEPSVRTVSSRTYDFGKTTDRTGKSIRSNKKKIDFDMLLGTSSEKVPKNPCRRLSMGIPPPRQTPKTRPRASLKRLEGILNGHTNSIRADSQHRSRGAVAPFGRSNRFDEIDNYSYRYDSRKSPGPVYSSCTSLNSTFNNESTLMNSSELRRPHDTTPHRDTSHVSESRVQDLRRELSDRRVLIELESKRMWASRGDRYAVATLPSFRSAIIMSNIDASPAEIDALYESFPSDSTWYVVFEREAREYLFSRSITHNTHSSNLHHSELHMYRSNAK